MTSPEPTRFPNGPATCPRNSTFVTCIVAAALTLFASGCIRHKVHAAAPVLVPPQPAAPIATTPTPKSPASIPAPVTPGPKNPTSATPPAGLSPKPNRLTKPAILPEPERPAAPQISPEMTPSAEAQLTKQTEQYIVGAQRNLRRADGRSLTPAQRDMVDKIRGFLDQAQDAMRTSDWSRAKNLSQKAYLLSIELAKTL